MLAVRGVFYEFLYLTKLLYSKQIFNSKRYLTKESTQADLQPMRMSCLGQLQVDNSKLLIKKNKRTFGLTVVIVCTVLYIKSLMPVSAWVFYLETGIIF